MDAHNAWTRRQWLQGAVLGTAGVMGSAAASSGEIGQPLVEPPDLSFLKRESLMNADRLRFFMEQAGLDVLVAAYPANVYYLTNHWPQSDRMGWQHSGIAIFSRDPARPLDERQGLGSAGQLARSELQL